MILETIIKWIIPVVGTGLLGLLGYIVKSNHTMKNSMFLLLHLQIVGKCEKLGVLIQEAEKRGLRYE